MGLYYTPPPPHIGATQPLTPKELTPPSGPAPSNPVFGAVSLAATLVAAWSAVAAPLPQRAPPVAAIAAGPAAQQPPHPLPQPYAWGVADWPQPRRQYVTPSGPPPQAPPINGAAAIPESVLLSWAAPAWLPELPGFVPQSAAVSNPPPPPRQVYVWAPADWPQPARRNLTLSGPAPSNPPPRAQAVPTEILVSWVPIAGGLPQASPALITLPPATVTPAGVQGAPLAIFAAWAPPAWPQAPGPRQIISGPAASNPPVRVQTVRTEVLLGWPPPPPQPPVAVNLNPPIGVTVPQAPPINAAIPPVWPYPVVLQVFSGAYKMIYLYPPPLPAQTPSVNLAFDISSILGINNPIVSLSSQGYPVPTAINSPQSGLLQAFFVQMSVINQYPKLTIYIQTALGDRYNVIFSPPL